MSPNLLTENPCHSPEISSPTCFHCIQRPFEGTDTSRQVRRSRLR